MNLFAENPEEVKQASIQCALSIAKEHGTAAVNFTLQGKVFVSRSRGAYFIHDRFGGQMIGSYDPREVEAYLNNIMFVESLN